ncbi:MAG: hypothetical protein JNJ57_15305 [Saprospiraceae bacterium]|nr:hypothetical protein [Saprospiraceae bacterium]
MNKRYALCFIAFGLLAMTPQAHANFITATPANYTSFLAALQAGDTLYLSPGVYTNNLALSDLSGTATQPIVITGAGEATVIQGQACCNTVSLTRCEYLVLSNFKLDGLGEFVDAVKAEGTNNNWAHHITIEGLTIVNYDVDQQAVGISTKCSAWNWIIRRNRILGAGTGIYLGNSDGTRPFVNGVIEYNYIAHTVGYNLQIKHQLNNVRDAFPGTAVDGKTIIRYNVFTKDTVNSSTGGNARPNLLVGGFPLTGWGSMDYYEIYGNFFYNNPVEALFQGTGNVQMYNNIFVNHFNPSGFRAVYFTPQNGVSPQDIRVFHNTVWTANTAGGIRLASPNAAYHQYCYANAVFSTSAITNFTDNQDNITDTYANAGNYVLSASPTLDNLDLYPKSGQLAGLFTPSVAFDGFTDWNKDFNGDTYTWNYRGAYAGCCENPGWKLQLDTMPVRTTPLSGTHTVIGDQPEISIFPNPNFGTFTIQCPEVPVAIRVFDLAGRMILDLKPENAQTTLELHRPGLYLVQSIMDSVVTSPVLTVQK